MAKKVKKDALEQHWVHSHEEDTETEQVFRPATYDFPLSRGRDSFELRPGGGLVKRGPSPTDRPQETAGRWKLEDDDKIAFYPESSSEPTRRLKIASVDKDRLVVKKPR